MSTFWLQVFSIFGGVECYCIPMVKTNKICVIATMAELPEERKKGMATPSEIAFALGHNRPFPQGDREGHCARSARAITLFCGVFLGNQTCRVSNSTPICNDCATLFFQSGAHTFLARARARARRGRRKAKTYRDPETKVKEKWNF